MSGIGVWELVVAFVLLVLIGVAVMAVLRVLGGGSRSAGRENRDARRILDERYASGEISRDDYQQIRQDIES